MNKNIVETGTYEYKGCNVTWEYDEYPDNPRTWDLNLSRMICWDGRYEFGDEHSIGDTRELLETIVAECYKDSELPCDICDMNNDELQKLAKAVAVIKPIVVYEHSVLDIWYGAPTCPFDCRYVGYGYMTKNATLEQVGEATEENWREHAERVMAQEMDLYAQYVRGEVYRYKVEDADGNYIDSCCGIYSDSVHEFDDEIKDTIDEYMAKCQTVDRIWSAFAIE